MERVPTFNPQQLTAIAKILGETGGGLKGTEIGYLLQDARIPDVSPDMTKWKRLFNAFVEHQNAKQSRLLARAIKRRRPKLSRRVRRRS